jgi:hypothetical protein
MVHTYDSVSVKRPTAAETTLAAAILGLVFTSQLVVSRSFSLFTRHFWVDEIFTYTLVSDPDVGHSMCATAAGFDTNPPGLQLLLRGFAFLTGTAGEVTLRSFALLSVVVALLGIYVLIRQVYTPLAAFAAALVVGVHPLVLLHAFEARYYGPWLAAIIWFAYFLDRSRAFPGRWFANLMLAICAVLVCTIHYFGVITLGLVLGFELLFHPAAQTLRWPGLWLTALGPIALAACAPFLLSQRSGYTVPTWVSDPTPDMVVTFILVLFPRYLGAVLGAAWLSQLFPGKGGRDCLDTESGGRPAVLAGLTGLILLPLILLVFSYAVLPVLVDRYALPAVAGLAPAVAFAVSRTSRFWASALCGFLVLLGTHHMGALRGWYDQRDQQTAELMDALRRHTAGEPVLFESSHELYVVCRYAPDLAPRCYALDFKEGQLGHIDAFRLFLRDAVRMYARFYPEPALMTWDVARTLPKLYLVAQGGTHLESDAGPEKRYPGFTPRLIAERLYELVAAPQGP